MIWSSDALIVVDVQNDFCPGGALAISGGDQVVRTINGLICRFDHIVFTRDWHPVDHCSFDDAPKFVDKSWPPHCLADSPGAAFHGDLRVPLDAMIVNKGGDPDVEAYSGFQDTTLAEDLRKRGIKRVFVCGLATDYCVKSTALDALREGVTVVLVADACQGVDVPEGSVKKALAEMRAAGIQMHSAGEIE